MYSGGTGTELDPYLIATAQDFKDIENNMTGKYFKQTADISLGIMLPLGYNGGNTAPITFTGTYDGNGFKLQSAYISYTCLTECGIFRSISNSIIKNIVLDNITVDGKSSTGGLVGTAISSTISDIQVYNTIVTSGRTETSSIYNGGALIGLATTCTIFNIQFYNVRVTGISEVGVLAGSAITNSIVYNIYTHSDCAIVSLSNSVGGIIGTLKTNSAIENCTNNAGVYCKASNAGGIVGYIDVATIQNCLNLKSVYGNNSGGIAGGVSSGTSTITKCINIGNIIKSTDSGGIVGSIESSTTIVSKCFALCEKTNGYRIAGAKNAYLTNNYALDTMYIGQGSSYKTADDINGASITAANAKKKINYTLIDWSFTDTAGYWNINEDASYPILLSTPNGYNVYYSGGNGTAANPYLISNVTDLKNIECDMTDKYFKQTTDITLGNFEPIGYNGGSLISDFLGYYDGNNFSLKDGIINYPTLDYVGIFCRASNAEWFKNLQIINVQVTGKQYVGTLIGAGHGGIFTNIHVDSMSSVTGLSRYVGGITGACAYYTPYSVTKRDAFTACSNAANIIGDSYVGGIVGLMYDHRIVNCINTGAISATSTTNSYIGGIVGHARNQSSVPDILKCINAGNISGFSYMGGIIGNNDTSSDVQYCYALNNTITRLRGSSSTKIGRISGNQTAYLNYNYALETMLFVSL